MTLTRLEKTALCLAGITALGVGATITLAPRAFYASYGIVLGDSPSLLSELRAPAAGLTVLGLAMLLGLWRAAMAPLAMAASLVVFLGFPAGRLIGLAVDGLPSTGILAALFLEIAVAALCLAAFRGRLTGGGVRV